MMIRRAFIDVPWGQLHYREVGPAAAPALVLLHQTALSGRSWEPVFPLFADEFHVYAPDTPGYGDSSAPETRPTLDWYVDALRAWMDAVGLAQAAFIGHHTGAALGARLAVQSPERVSHLVLSMPPLFTGEESARYRSIQAAAELHADGSNLLAAWSMQARANHERLNLELVYWDTVESLRAWPRGVWAIQALAEADLGADLAAIRHPALILHNTTDPLVRHWERIHEVAPQLDRVLIPTRTVDVFLEKGDEVTPLLKRFLRG